MQISNFFFSDIKPLLILCFWHDMLHKDQLPLWLWVGILGIFVLLFEWFYFSYFEALCFPAFNLFFFFPIELAFIIIIMMLFDWFVHLLSVICIVDETAKWEKITYVGIATCTILTIYNLSKGHPHHEEPPVSFLL